MMTSLTSSLPIDLNVLRAPPAPRREGSASFADDLSAASEAPVAASEAPSLPPTTTPTPSPDHQATSTPTERRAQQRDDRRDDVGDVPREERRDVPGAERRDARQDEHGDERDQPRDTRRPARRDERRAALERARTARPKAQPAADDGMKRTAPHERSAKAQAEPAPPELAAAPSAPATVSAPSTADFAARTDAAATGDARHSNALDALRQHLAAAQSAAGAPHGHAASALQGDANVDAEGARASITEGASRVARPQDARTSRDARPLRDTRAEAPVDGMPPPQGSVAADAVATFDTTGAATARGDFATAMPDAARPVGRGATQGRAQMRGDADDASVAANRRGEVDASAAVGDTARAASERTAQADVSAATWRDVFAMPAPQAATVGATYSVAGSAALQASSPGAPEHTIAAAPGSAEFTRALSSQVTFWAREGTQEARLQLNPADLGPVTVLIAIDGTQARIDFHAHAAATREAIEASLPSLAGALGEQGLELSGGGVFDRSDRESSAPSQQAARTTASGRDASHDADDADDAARGLLAGARTTAPRGLVDLVA